MGLKALVNTIIVVLLVWLALSSYAVNCKPNYIFSYTEIVFKDAVCLVLPLADTDNTYVLAFKNGTIALLKGLEVIGRIRLPAKPLAYDHVNGKIYLLLEDGSLAILSTPSLQVEKFLHVTEKDEEPEYLAVSPRGNYGVLAVRYKYQGAHDASRLVFFDLNSGERILVRDVESVPMLVKLFYFRRVGEILILQTLDTFCELCEYTDNKIEAYNISSLKLLYSKKIGLSFVDVEERKGLVVLVRALREREKHKLIVLNLSNGAVKSEFEIVERPSGALVRGGSVLVTTTEQSIVAYSYTNGRKIAKLKIGESITFGKMDNLIVVGSPYRVYVITPALDVLWVKRIEYYGVPRPPIVACHKGNGLIIYAERHALHLEVYTTSILKVFVVDKAGNPIPGANVTIVEEGIPKASTMTNSSGYATLTAKPHTRIKIRVSKEGYATREVSVLPSNPIERVKVVLSRAKYLSKLTVIAKYKNEPLREVLVYLKDSETGVIVESDVTDDEGKCLFEGLAPGMYILEAIKPGFKLLVENVSIDGVSSVELVLNFELELYNFSVKVLGVEAKYNLTVIDENYNIVWRGAVPVNASTYIGSLKPGLYKVSGEGLCGSNTTRVMLDRNVVFQLNVRSDVYCLKREGLVVDENMLKEIVDEICRNTLYCNNSVNVYLGDASFSSFNETGDVLELSQRNRVFVVAFFYTKCWGCEKVIPLLKELESKYPAIKAAMVTIYSTDTYDDIVRYIKEHNVTVPVYRDVGGIHERLGIKVVPSVIAAYKGKVLVLGIGIKSKEGIGTSISFEWVSGGLSLIDLLDALPTVSLALGLTLYVVACIILLLSRRGEEV